MPLYDNFSDRELVLMLATGDHVAYTEIYNRYARCLYLQGYSSLKSEEEARDIVQDLFASLWYKRASLQLKTSLSNYLYTAVKNRVLDIIAHKQVASRYILAQPKSVNTDNRIADHPIREKQLANIIEREIQAMPPKVRKVFELSRKAYLSHKEIAKLLGLTEQSVRSNIKDALRILRIRTSRLSVDFCDA